MNFDPHYTIEQIQQLAGDHPEEVATLLEAYEQLLSFSAAGPRIDDLANPEHTHRVMNELVMHKATSGEAVSQAKESGANLLRHKLTQAVRGNLDHYLSFQRANFDKAAEKYTAAVAKLPEEFTNDEALSFTPAQFKALGDARSAVFDLKGARAWLVALPNLSQSIRYDGQTQSLNHLILSSVDKESWNSIQYAPDYSGADAAFASIAPEIRHALNHGAEFKLSTPAEATARNRELSSTTAWVG